jgi:hypothetical protein
MNDLRTDIDRLFEQRPIPVSDIALRLVHAALDRRSSDLPVVRDIAELDELMDEVLASPAMSCLPAWGHEGIDVLLDLAFGEGRKFKTQHRALEVLLSVSLGIIPTSKTVKFLPPSWEVMPHYVLSNDTQQYCSQRVREHVLSCLGDQEGKRNLFFALGQMSLFSGWQEDDHILFDRLLDMIIDSHLILSLDLIEEFAAKLDSGPDREEDLQRFLADHPILLDPFVKVMHSKQHLGSDFITDYVLRRMNDEYILVEIENSTDALFRADGSFTPELMTAVGQVRDFQAWVSENLAYARKKMPNITHPEGLVVIGRRRDLDGAAARRLAEENFSRRGHIKIVTYDDLLDQAHSVHANLIAAPVVLQSRDTKSI